MRIVPGTRTVVTGASRGIGQALSAELASRGARVGLVARGKDGLEAVADELPASAAGDHMTSVADVSKWGQTKRAMDRLAKGLGGIELLVANAGVLHYAPFVDQDMADAEQMVNVNVLGTLHTVKAALPHMLDTTNERHLPVAEPYGSAPTGPRGHIVILSSAAGLRSFPWGAVYGGTKAFDRGFGEALRHELAGTGISLTVVYPGEFATTILEHQRDRLPAWRTNDEERPVAELVAAIVAGIENDSRAVYAPGVVRVLGLSGILPRLTDRLLVRIRGRAAAPRMD